jgi:flagellin-specific chaperone FliS
MPDDLPAWWTPPPPRDACAGAGERTVLLLYAEALAALRRARIASVNNVSDVGRVLAILAELTAALCEREDREEVVHLTSLYRYMSHRLMDVAELGALRGIGEVERLLQTLWEGWVQVIQPDVDGGFPASLEEDDRVEPRPSVGFYLS